MGNWGKKWTSFSSPYDIVECAAAASPVAADTEVCLAVRAEDGEISIFSHPFSTLVLCFQFPLGCMIISSIFCYLTVTIPSFSFSFTFLVFLFTINSLSFMPSTSLFFNYKPMGPGVLKLLSCPLWLLQSLGTCPYSIEGTNGHHMLWEAETHKHRNLQLHDTDFKSQLITTSACLPQISDPSVSCDNLGFDQLTLLKSLVESKTVAQEEKTPMLPTLTSEPTRKHWSFRRYLGYYK